MSLKAEDVDGCSYAEDTTEIEHDGVKHQTDLAVLFDISGDDTWIPKSVIADVEENTVWVATWFAEKEGLL